MPHVHVHVYMMYMCPSHKMNLQMTEDSTRGDTCAESIVKP